jgi:phage shock protein PspC (stress-responsive transcriptional regulator)
MNKVITINLNGNAHQLEEEGYEALRAYLDGAARRLEGNPDRDEIIADIEQSIADKCRAMLGANKTVVLTREVRQIIDEMGPIEDAGGAEGATAAAGPAEKESGKAAAGGTGTAAGVPPRRLYKVLDGAMIGGVCNGLSAYWNIDVSAIRIAFVCGSLIWGVGILVYLAMLFIVPTAQTSEEKAAAEGIPFTAEEFVRRARAGYYAGMRRFADKHARREWHRRFRREMRSWRHAFHQEMRASAYDWRGPPAAWGPPVAFSPGALVALPFVSIARKALTLCWLVALVSLLATGTVLGVPPPAAVPVWATVLILLFVYLALAWPLKALRHAYYWRAGWGPQGVPPFVYAFDAVLGVAFLLLLLWLGLHHLPEIREAIHQLPGVCREAAETIKAWWAKP